MLGCHKETMEIAGLVIEFNILNCFPRLRLEHPILGAVVTNISRRKIIIFGGGQLPPPPPQINNYLRGCGLLRIVLLIILFTGHE